MNIATSMHWQGVGNVKGDCGARAIQGPARDWGDTAVVRPSHAAYVDSCSWANAA